LLIAYNNNNNNSNNNPKNALLTLLYKWYPLSRCRRKRRMGDARDAEEKHDQVQFAREL